MLTRDELLKATIRRFEDLVLPDDFPVESLRGKSIRCWSMSAGQQSSFESGLIDYETGKTNTSTVEEIKLRKFIATVGDDLGNPLFTIDDIESVKQLDAAVIDAVCDISNRLNVLKGHDKKAAAMESAKKN